MLTKENDLYSYIKVDPREIFKNHEYIESSLNLKRNLIN